jgi:cytochrome c1
VALPVAASAQDAPNGDPVAGKQLFDDEDLLFLSRRMSGREPRRTSAAPPMAFPAFLAQLSEPRAIMPPYKEAILSDQQAADIVAYLASLPRRPGPQICPAAAAVVD